jgi:hypothetical protein
MPAHTTVFDELFARIAGDHPAEILTGCRAFGDDTLNAWLDQPHQGRCPDTAIGGIATAAWLSTHTTPVDAAIAGHHLNLSVWPNGATFSNLTRNLNYADLPATAEGLEGAAARVSSWSNTVDNNHWVLRDDEPDQLFRWLPTVAAAGGARLGTHSRDELHTIFGGLLVVAPERTAELIRIASLFDNGTETLSRVRTRTGITVTRYQPTDPTDPTLAGICAAIREQGQIDEPLWALLSRHCGPAVYTIFDDIRAGRVRNNDTGFTNHRWARMDWRTVADVLRWATHQTRWRDAEPTLQDVSVTEALILAGALPVRWHQRIVNLWAASPPHIRDARLPIVSYAELTAACDRIPDSIAAAILTPHLAYDSTIVDALLRRDDTIQHAACALLSGSDTDTLDQVAYITRDMTVNGPVLTWLADRYDLDAANSYVPDTRFSTNNNSRAGRHLLSVLGTNSNAWNTFRMLLDDNEPTAPGQVAALAHTAAALHQPAATGA